MPTTTNIPQQSLTAGQTGNIVSGPVPTASPGYLLTIQQVGWAHTGGDALKVWLDCSYDNQATWINLTADVFPDEAVPVVKTFPADSFRVTAGIDPEVGGVKRRLRLRYEAVKAVTVSGTITAL